MRQVAPSQPDPLDRYQRRLLVFLSVATFFDGYDTIALTQVLPHLRLAMGLTPATEGLLVGVVNLGTVAAFLLVRLADRLGRRRLLTVTIGGYTVFTIASGLAPDLWSFAAAQFVARIFLVGESAVAMVYVAEELPAIRRGLAIGVVQGSLSLGMIACAVTVPLLSRSAVGWRGVYFVGAVALLLLMVCRRGLRETKRFAARAAAGPVGSRPMWAAWNSPYRNRIIRMGAVWACTFACTQTAVAFWKEFAVGERGLSDATVAVMIGGASLLAWPLVVGAGKLLDLVGRRAGAAVIFSIEVVAVVGSFSQGPQWWLATALAMGIFGAGATQVVLNAFTTELFPTEIRGAAFAWSSQLLGRIGYVGVPVLVGYLAGSIGWGPAVTLTAIGPLAALGLILTSLQETRGRELEDTAALPPADGVPT